MDEIIETVDNYHIYNTILGSGSFCKVHLGFDIINNRNVAIKIPNLTSGLHNKDHIISIVKSEYEIMKNLSHPWIVQVYDLLEENGKVYVVMEYCDQGTLSNIVESNKSCSAYHAEKETLYCLSQLKEVLTYLNGKKIMHRDIKTANILLTTPMEPGEYSYIIKLADFGTAKEIEENPLNQTCCGSPLYMAPEMLCNVDYNDSIDLWSFGIVMYELLFGGYPWDASNINDLKEKVLKSKLNIPSNNYSSNANLLMQSLIISKDKRLIWRNFLNHSWFDGEQAALPNCNVLRLGVFEEESSSPKSWGELSSFQKYMLENRSTQMTRFNDF